MRVDRNSTVTTEFLAKACNVSQGTVDRALHDRKGISQKTKERILAVAKEYGYRPDFAARCLVKGRDFGLIGIVVFDLYNSYFSEMIMRLEGIFREHGIFSIVMFSDKSREHEKECVEALYSAGVDGIIICSANKEETYGEYLSGFQIPVIAIGNRIKGIPYVGVDNFRAMYEVTCYALEQGCSKLIYYAPVLKYIDQNISGQELRYQGFLQASREAECDFEVWTGEAEGLHTALSKGDTMVIASTDYYAYKLILAGAPVGQIIGFDGSKNEYVESGILPTVDCDLALTAEKIVSCFLEGAYEDILIPHRLVVGNSEQPTVAHAAEKCL